MHVGILFSLSRLRANFHPHRPPQDPIIPALPGHLPEHAAMRMGRTPQLKSSIQEHNGGREAKTNTNDPWQEGCLERAAT
jgi:hypothetical protein